jgi:hypothetical protein
MPASVHSLADVTRKPNENADAVILHYKAINAELEAQLAVACAQRDAWRQLVEHCWRLVDGVRRQRPAHHQGDPGQRRHHNARHRPRPNGPRHPNRSWL